MFEIHFYIRESFSDIRNDIRNYFLISEFQFQKIVNKVPFCVPYTSILDRGAVRVPFNGVAYFLMRTWNIQWPQIS